MKNTNLTEEEKKNLREKRKQYNLKYRQKMREKEEEKEEQKEEKEKEKEEQEEDETEEKEEIQEQEEQEEEDTVYINRKAYEYLCEKARKGIAIESTHPQKKEIITNKKLPLKEEKKEDSFFFQMMNQMKRHAVSSLASAGSVLALSLAIRGSQYCWNSMNISRCINGTTTTSTPSNRTPAPHADTQSIRMVSIG